MPKLSPFEGDLADLFIDRLNQIAMHDKKAMGALIEARVPCSDNLVEHPSVQVQGQEVGFLGVINGIVGTIPEGRMKGWGYICAVFDAEGNFERFRRTDQPETVAEHIDNEVFDNLHAAIAAESE